MTLYTIMPLELALEGWSEEPAPMLEIMLGKCHLLLSPVAPGVGKVVRLLSAPLEDYLLPQYEPGQLIYYGLLGYVGGQGQADLPLNENDAAQGLAER